MNDIVLVPISMDNFLIALRSVIKEEISSLSLSENVHDNKPVNGAEICKFLNITETTLIRWRSKGKIPFMQFGRNYRYDKNAVSKAIESTRKK
jgi:excisionase family DNA binding protein